MKQRLPGKWIFTMVFALALTVQVSSCPGLAAPSLASINAQYARGDCTGATSAIGQFLRQKVSPADAAKAWKILGVCAGRMGKSELATRNFKTALGFDRTTRLTTQEAADPRVTKSFAAAGGNPAGVAAQKSQRPPALSTGQQKITKPNLLKQTTLSVKSNVPGAIVTQDGIILGPVGSTFEVEPGNLVIEVSAPGYQAKKTRVAARANTPNQVSVNLDKAIVKQPPRPKPQPKQPSNQRQAVASRPGGKSPQGAQAGKSQKSGSKLFGDDFAGTTSNAPPAGVQPGRRQAAPQRPAGRPNVPSYEPGYDPSGGGYSGPVPQQQPPMAPSYPQGPAYNPGYAPPGYGQPYNPGYAPGYPYPGYGGYGNVPYPPTYPAPMYQQPAPAPYYYYPQNIQPPIAAPAPQIVVPMDPISSPPASQAPLPSVAEAPDLSGPPPELEEPAPKVGTTKKAASSGGRNPFVKYLPFGAGQYQNGDTLLGVAFTTGQAGTLLLYMMNTSNAAKGAENYNKSMALAKSASDDTTAEAYEKDAENWKTYSQQSSQNATLCLVGFGAAYAASIIEASIHTPTGKSKKSRGRRRGFAFESGIGTEGLEAQISYNF
ncbi:MAG: hypothetical protein RIQ81_987 [Pseudomonadota bacterium]|jgi:hypothetical protein